MCPSRDGNPFSDGLASWRSGFLVCDPEPHTPMRPHLAIRVDATNPDHHLWCNHGSWWIHYTLHLGPRRRRVRRPLGTRDVQEARRLRDELFAALAPEVRA